MRVIHFSDTHLGHQQFSRTDPATGLNQREQDHYDAFEQIIEHCLEVRPDLVIHAGDLFDGVRPSNRALAVALDGFVRLDRAGIPTIVIAGNHEHPKMLETGSPFRLFDHLEHVHAVYKGQAEAIDIGGRTVHAVPQCQDHATLRRTMQSICAQADGNPGRDLLILHGGIMGMDAFHHAEFNELSLDPTWFTGDNAERFAYVALGHFHGRSEIGPRAHYCGAPDRVSMKESGETKGFLDVQLDPFKITFHATRVRPYVDLPRIHGAGQDAAAVEAACIEALAKLPEGAVARLRAEGISADLRGALDWKAIRAAGAHVLDVNLDLRFEDDDHHAATGAVMRGLDQEFDAFASTYPMEGMDRKTLVAAARELLGA
ncbi:MAG: metallophosphoesterase family protein [Thermoplasmatota archaeon]